jgi:hypothetical protein
MTPPTKKRSAAAATRDTLPFDQITSVSVLDPYFYR